MTFIPRPGAQRPQAATQAAKPGQMSAVEMMQSQYQIMMSQQHTHGRSNLPPAQPKPVMPSQMPMPQPVAMPMPAPVGQPMFGAMPQPGQPMPVAMP